MFSRLLDKLNFSETPCITVYVCLMPTIVVYLDSVAECVSQQWHLPPEHTNVFSIRLCGYRFVCELDHHPSLQIDLSKGFHQFIEFTTNRDVQLVTAHSTSRHSLNQMV